MANSEHPHRPVQAVTVRLADGRVWRFGQPFHIGRDQACEIRIDDPRVSRRHAIVSVHAGEWSVRDLQSINGVFTGGRRVESAPVGDGVTFSLGAEGPSITVLPEAAVAAPPPRTIPSAPARASDLRTAAVAAPRQPMPEPTPPAADDALLEGYAQRYFGTSEDEDVGSRTMMIRRAFQQVQQKQKRRHRLAVSVVALLGLFAAGYAYYGHVQLQKQQALARELFYSMKTLDVEIATVEQKMGQSGGGQGEVARYMEQRRQMESNYDQFLSTLYDRRLNEKERLILTVTRKLGECELAAPPEYIREVSRYIQKWQATGRFTRAVKLAQDLGYPKKIASEFIARDLPPQFFYLAMQESDFDAFRSGPKTRMGIAKGMWQFIPETGARYGLNIGPLASVPRADAQDDRLNWEKATAAAAKYVKEIYATDAQASGLLVMASYNWGERRVIDLIRTLPPNPRDRNFWKLLERYRDRLPVETYDYVFYIVSAAVIGENPRLFGFQIDSPLGFLSQQS
jgi:membrane-bound lytic murein transglycosylase D